MKQRLKLNKHRRTPPSSTNLNTQWPLVPASNGFVCHHCIIFILHFPTPDSRNILGRLLSNPFTVAPFSILVYNNQQYEVIFVLSDATIETTKSRHQQINKIPIICQNLDAFLARPHQIILRWLLLFSSCLIINKMG